MVPWKPLALVTVTAGIVSSLTDWLFSGDWLHPFYNRNREVWRYPGGQGESQAIAWASAWPFVTAALFGVVAIRFGITSLRDTLTLAALIWAMAPLPVLVTHALFIKIHPVICLSHSIGWLVRLAVVAVAVWWFLR